MLIGRETDERAVYWKSVLSSEFFFKYKTVLKERLFKNEKVVNFLKL